MCIAMDVFLLGLTTDYSGSAERDGIIGAVGHVTQLRGSSTEGESKRGLHTQPLPSSSSTTTHSAGELMQLD